MAMATRFRTKKATDNVEPTRVGGKSLVVAPKLTLADAKDKRRVFGDIENKIGSWSSQDEKSKSTVAAYKDVKPRVDSRWRKTGVLAQPVSKTNSLSSVAPAASKPAARQVSNPKSSASSNDIFKNVFVKSTKILDIKKERSTGSSSSTDSGDLQLAKSPLRLSKVKPENVMKNFYESHSTKLLGQVENIDEKDIDNPQNLAEYVNDIYRYLFKLEKVFPIRANFLSNQVDVTPKMRSVLLDWLNEVHLQFNLENETFYMAVSMIDRYLQSCSNTPRRSLQLVGVTALFMASKYEELMPPEIQDFVYVTDDTYSKHQILQMEKKIFFGLQFNLSKPLPIHFLRRFAKAAGSLGDRTYLAAKYFMELAAVDYEMTKFNPSQVAAASLYLSLHIFNAIKCDRDLWTPTLEYYSTYTAESLIPVMKRLATLVVTAKDAKLRSIHNKYSNAVRKFIATVPEMNGLKINELITRL